MATPTFAVARALGITEASLEAFAAILSGQNSDGTQFSIPVAGGNVPPGATMITATATGAHSAAVATLAGVASKTTFITGFQVTVGGATGASLITVAVAGTISGTMNYTVAVPAGATLAAPPLIVTFPTPVPASAANTAITVTIPDAGAGNTATNVSAQGYQL